MQEGQQPAPPPEGADSERWWESFGSPTLSALVDRALAANLEIEARRLRVREAELDPAVPRSFLWPLRLDVTGEISRSRDFADLAQTTSQFFSQSGLLATASYELDLAGRRAALRRAAGQREEALRNQGEAVASAVAAEVADTWFALLEERSQHALLTRQVDEGMGFLSLVQARVDQGLASRLDLLQQRLQVATTKALLPQVEDREHKFENRLSTLLGEERSRLPGEATLPQLPSKPSSTAEQIAHRPDVREAEARIAEAQARERAQLATWAPTISLFARGGERTFELTQSPFRPIWGFGAQLVWPLYDGGQRSLATAQLEAESERLRAERAQVVLRAARDVDDAFVSEDKTAEYLAEIADELSTGRAALEEAKTRYQHGLNDYTPVLTSLRIVFELERSRLTAQAQLLAVRVHLHEVLTGADRARP
jgi:multidrug efflux system outer membrane protein